MKRSCAGVLWTVLMGSALGIGALCVGVPARPAAARTAVSEAVKLRGVKIARQGSRAFARKKFDLALKYWRKAYSVYPNPQLLFNIALAYKALEEPAKAMIYVREFLKEAKPTGSARRRRQIRRLIRAAENLQKELEPLVATLEAKGEKGALVFVDKKLVGTLPLQIVLRPGKRKLEFRSEGKPSVHRELELQPGKTAVVEIKFPVVRPKPRPRPRPNNGGKGLHMAYALSAGGLAVALACIAIGTGVRATQVFEDFEDQPTVENRDRVRSWRDATNSLWGISGAALVAAVVLGVFTNWRRRKEAPSPTGLQLNIEAAPTGFGLRVTGKY
jgi:hypothetical protein